MPRHNFNFERISIEYDVFDFKTHSENASMQEYNVTCNMEHILYAIFIR